MKMENGEFTAFFPGLDSASIARAGGKGAQLGEMTRAGFLVPEGFVVLTAAFDWFTNKSGVDSKVYNLIQEIDENDSNAVNDLSEKIRKMILDAEIPVEITDSVKKSFKELGAEFVAVRSSASAEDSSSASWAGELETYTNVTEKNLIESVKKCWSSLYTPRAIVYRIEKKLRHEEVAVAVVVQKMVQSDIAGVMFTAHPVTNDLTKIVIDAGHGLGESVVAGLITPDNYIVDKNEMFIESIDVNKQEKMFSKINGETRHVAVPEDVQENQKLSGEQIMFVAEMGKKIEAHYRDPQDIEWAFEKGKLYILQSRPITTLK